MEQNYCGFADWPACPPSSPIDGDILASSGDMGEVIFVVGGLLVVVGLILLATVAVRKVMDWWYSR